MVRGLLGSLMLGMMYAVENQPASVLAVESVVDRVAITSRLHQPRQTQLREVLRDRGGWLPHGLGKLSDGQLSIEQTPDQPNSGAVGEHTKHFDCQVNLVDRRQLDTTICTHT